jgi:hypothetical protein
MGNDLVGTCSTDNSVLPLGTVKMSERTKSILILALAVGLVIYWSWVIEDELTNLSLLVSPSQNGHKEATIIPMEKEPAERIGNESDGI